MRFFRPFPKLINAPIFLLLVAALLLAQWVGLHHRIVHAGGIHGPHASLQEHQPAPQNNGIDDRDHSCAAFDAATLADSVSTVPFLTLLLPSTHAMALWLAFASWDAPLLCHFSSRAPPHA